jgi:hypothetical protein
MKHMPRILLALLGGTVAAMVAIVVLETAGHAWLGATPDPALPAFGARAVLLLAVVFAHAAGTLLGAWTTTRLTPGRPRWTGWIVALIVLSGAVSNLMKIQHPYWFAVLDLGSIAAAGWFGAVWASTSRDIRDAVSREG